MYTLLLNYKNIYLYKKEYKALYQIYWKSKTLSDQSRPLYRTI